MRKIFLSIVLIFSIAFTITTHAGEALDIISFANKSDSARYQALTHKLRCLVCQNQSLAESDAGLAKDLKREVYDMVNTGTSNEEIIAFLVNRYGDFVLYKPPVKGSTYILWFAPGLLFLFAIIFIFITINKNKKVKSGALTDEEQKKINVLLQEED